MFIVELFTVAKIWKPRYIIECYSAMRKKEILPFAIRWLELAGIMLTEISQKDKYSMI